MSSLRDYLISMDARSPFFIRPSLRCLGLGIVVGLCSMVPHLWPLIFVGIVPLFPLISGHSVSWSSAVRRGALFGIGYAGVVFFWTLNWLGLLLETDLPLTLALIMSAYSWLLTVGAHVVGYALWAGAHWYVWKHVKNHPHGAAVLTALLFVCAEMFGVFMFQLFYLSPVSTLMPHFSFAMIGYALGQHVIPLQYAWIGGIWLLSFVVIYANVIISMLIVHRERVGAYILICIALIPTLLYAYRAPTEPMPTLNVGVVHTNFDTNFETGDQDMRLRYLYLNAQLLELLSLHPALILLPEGSGFANLDATFGAETEGQRSFPLIIDKKIVLVDSAPEQIGAEQRARIHYWGAPYEIYSDKRVLLPQGEYVPYIQYLLQEYMASPETIRRLQELRMFSPGQPSSSVAVANSIVAGRFCSESMSPFLYVYNAYEGAQLFLNVASHSWFLESNLLSFRTENIARVRAVESGRWYIQAGNRTSSFVIDHLGGVVAEIDDASPRALAVDLRTDITPYQWIANHIIHAWVQ